MRRALAVTSSVIALLTLPPPPSQASAPVVAAVGDAACDPADVAYRGGAGTGTGSAARCEHRAVSDLILSEAPTAFLPLGDNQYEDGTLAKHRQSWQPTFGRLDAIARPVMGNHEARDRQGRGHYDYWGRKAGPRGKGYYSYDVGSWHLVAANTCEVGQSSRCRPSAEQVAWFRADLAANKAKCTLVYFHHPRWSGETGSAGGSNTRVAPLMEAAYADRAEVVLNGHAHNYERFRKQRPDGSADRKHGLRQFIVGTGGKNTRPFSEEPARGSLVREQTHGALFLTLRRGSYDWRYVDVDGRTLDEGEGAPCRS